MATISFAFGTWSCFGKSDAMPLRVSNRGSLSFSKQCYTGLKAGKSLLSFTADKNQHNWIKQGRHLKARKPLLTFKAKVKMNDNADDGKKHKKEGKDNDSWKAECVLLAILFIYWIIIGKVRKPLKIPDGPVIVKMTEQVVAKEIKPLRCSNKDGHRGF